MPFFVAWWNATHVRLDPDLQQMQRLLRRMVEFAVLHAAPGLDNEAAGRQLGKHANWVRYWRKTWARDGFRLADKGGRGRKPVFSPSAGGDSQGAGLRAPRAA